MTARLRRLAALAVTAAAALTAACGGADAPAGPVDADPTLAGFAFQRAHDPSLAEDLVGTVSGDTIRVIVPPGTAVDSLVPSFTVPDGVTVTLDGVPQRSGVDAADFTRDRTYVVTAPDGTRRTYVVSVTVFTGLPVLWLSTVDNAPILDRENYVQGSLRVDGGKAHPEWSFAVATQVRGRGNSTWSAPKKPYRLKLASARTVLGFPAERDWVLLANYWDQSLARNALALQFSAALGMAFTPRCAPVELFLNGVHQGAYQLCDQVETGTFRVPMAPGGWFLELNDIRRVDPDETWFETPAIHEYTTVGHGDTIPSVWTFKAPDPPTPAQVDAVRQELVAFEDALYGPDFADPDLGYARRLDARSLVDWWLVMELTKNNDAAFSFGVYAYKGASGRITFGPVWDFDLAFGNYPYDGGPEGFKILVSGYLPRLLEDRAFVALMQERWAVLRSHRAEFDAFLTAYTAQLQLSQRRTHALWAPYGPAPQLRAEPFAGAALWRAPALRAAPAQPTFTDADYAAEVARLRSWLDARWAWLDARIGAL
ncbi:MAG: CotH kinase family protein [Gemmatimonadaceae bacterium]|nr:CotH kinase family protein [Gemmatimonadaceae bacterium]